MHLRELTGALLGFCYPTACACCQAPGEGASPLCPECLAKLTAVEDGGACDRCAMPLRDWGDPCPYCLGKGLRPYERIVSLGRFGGPLRELIHQMKYGHRWPLGEQLAERLLAQGRVRELLGEADCLLPVPLHWWRQVQRGYNQAEVIARQLGRRCDLSVVHPAVRRRWTATQTGLHSRAQREQNLRDAFKLRWASRIRGKRVVVVDDVMTTAATLRSLGRVLRRAKPASLSAIVVAVADPRGKSQQDE